MQKRKNKFFVLVLGVFFSLVVLEMALRFIGIVYSSSISAGKTVKRDSDAFVILCLGDSYTVGSGALNNNGYPTRLENLLRKEYPGKKIKVVNKGFGTLNTTMLLERFDGNVNEVDPDLIIILIGGANNWNAYGYGDHLNRKGWDSRLRDFFYNIKTFKLIKLIFYEVKNKKECLLKNDVASSSKGRRFTPQQTDWREIGVNCELEGKYDEAVSYYKKVLEENPLVYADLARVYFLMGDKEASRQCFRRLIEANPGRHQSYTLFASWFLRDPVRDKEDLQFIQQYADVNPVVGDILKSITDRSKYRQEMGDWIKHDIEEMIRRSRERGIGVILQDYPSYWDFYKDVNFYLREIARKNSVPFIDNEQILEGLFQKGERKDDYYAFDKAHCNEKGYDVMAKSIYCGIVLHNGLGILPAADSVEKNKCLELLHGVSRV